jgi:pyruvate, water dikinase
VSTAPALVRVTGGLGDADRARAGGKAVGLAALLRAGLTVPATWLVPVDAEPAGQELQELAAVAPRWAVRSSATVEDGAKLSYAGMFSSELDVPAADLAAAIGRVRASARNDRVAAYRERTGAARTGIQLAVLLQPFRRPACSGLWLGRGTDAGRLEWVTGCGDALVSGTVTPRWEEWPATGPPSGSEPEPLTCGEGPVGAACRDAQRALGGPADLELAILDTGLVWLQFRPVTAGLGAVPSGAEPAGPESAGRPLVQGLPAARGRATGRALLLADASDPRWVPGGVLLAERTDPDWVPLMAQAAALVTAEGGMLCHAAIVARELGVPCVTGVGPAALRALAAGDVLAVDGSAGTVAVLTSAPGDPAAGDRRARG